MHAHARIGVRKHLGGFGFGAKLFPTDDGTTTTRARNAHLFYSRTLPFFLFWLYAQWLDSSVAMIWTACSRNRLQRRVWLASKQKRLSQEHVPTGRWMIRSFPLFGFWNTETIFQPICRPQVEPDAFIVHTWIENQEEMTAGSLLRILVFSFAFTSSFQRWSVASFVGAISWLLALWVPSLRRQRWPLLRGFPLQIANLSRPRVSLSTGQPLSLWTRLSQS